MKQNMNDSFTKADGIELKKEILSEIDSKIDFKIVEKLDEIRDEMREQYSKIFNLVDGLAYEVNINEEFRLVTTNQIVEVEKRTGDLEKKVFGHVMSP